MKRLFFIILAILVLVPAGLVVWLLFFFDANNYRGQIESGFHKATGREMQISGDLNATIFPRIGISTGAITVGNARGFGDEPFASIQGSNISLALLPLLHGEVEMDKLLLDGVQANLITLADGKTNWDDLAGGGQPEKEKAQQPTGKDQGASLGALAIGGVELKQASITWDDRSAKTRIELRNLNLETGAITFDESIPVKFNTDFAMNDKEIAGKMTASTNTTINQKLDKISLRKLDANVAATGSLLEGGRLDTTVSSDADVDLGSQIITTKGAKLTIGMDGGKTLGDTRTKTTFTSDININLATQKITLSGTDLVLDADGEMLEGGKANAKMTSGISIDLANQKVSLNGTDLVAYVDGPLLEGGTANAKMTSNISVDLANEKVFLNGTDLVANVEGPLLDGGTLKTTVKSDIFVDLAKMVLTSKSVDAVIDMASNLVPVNPMQATLSSPLTVNLNELAIDLPQMKYSIPGSQGTGSLKLSKFNQPLPAVVVTLDTPEFVADPWLGESAAKSARAEPAKEGLLVRTIMLDALAQTAPATGAGAVEIPVDLIRNLDVDARLTMGSFKMQALHATDLKAELKGKGGVVKFEPMAAKLFGGGYDGFVHIDARGKLPKVRLKEDMNGIQIAQAIAYAMSENARDWLTGTAQVTADISTQGLDTGAMTQALNGTVDAVVRDGYLEGISLRKMIDKAKALYEKKTYADDGSPDRTKILELGMASKIVNGVAHSDNIKALTPLVDVTGNGQADLYHETLDYNLKLALSSGISDIDKARYEKLQGKSLPLKISGSFVDPKINLDLSGLARDEAKKRVEKEINKQLEKKLGDKYGDQLKELGKGLFGK